MERKITVGYWYIVGGPAGATVTVKGEVNPCCTVPEGGQGSFFAQAPVVIVSDDAITLSQVVNFNCAPVKLRLLGLLGGGVQTLPAGYLAADFLESTAIQYIDTGILPNGRLTTRITVLTRKWDGGSGTNFVFGSTPSWEVTTLYEFSMNYNWGYGTVGQFAYGSFRATPNAKNVLNTKYEFVFQKNKMFRDGVEVVGNEQTAEEDFESPYTLRIFGSRIKGQSSKVIYRFSVEDEGKELLNYVPALAPQGVPCMFDKVTKQPFYNAGSGQFIVGLTLAQALKLSKLPATGGSLTVSLPWEAQLIASGIPAILQAAAAKGWTITVQYREPEADNAYYNKYAECVTVADMQAVNADYKNDLTKDGEWIYPLPELINSSGAFARSDDFVSFDADLPELTYGVSMFRNMPKMEKFKGSLKALINGQEMFCYAYSFTDFDSTLERLDEGIYMFMGCQLNKESALNILYSVPSYTDRKHILHLGIHVDHKTDEEVLAAIADAEAKGWIINVGWNGTATAQTASTFGLRKPPIYAKLGTVERPDGTSEKILDWGHYVTDWEANGYREFGSVEEAKEYFNIIDEA